MGVWGLGEERGGGKTHGEREWRFQDSFLSLEDAGAEIPDVGPMLMSLAFLTAVPSFSSAAGVLRADEGCFNSAGVTFPNQSVQQAGWTPATRRIVRDVTAAGLA